jgi:predicted O-linked N-acetylglucosamine transferase (SPINDLY family)
MRILRASENAVLWLAGSNALADGNLRRVAERHGVAGERLVTMPIVTSSEDYLARYTLADVFLDVLPYNAISTAADALWAGLPIVTCAGGTFGGRGAGSMLRAVGLSELVCEDLAAYEATVVRLVRDRALLASLKDRLGVQTGLTLFDTDRFRRNIEAAFVTMLDRHHRGLAPADFDVAS